MENHHEFQSGVFIRFVPGFSKIPQKILFSIRFVLANYPGQTIMSLAISFLRKCFKAGKIFLNIKESQAF
jgi:hypothetical protein